MQHIPIPPSQDVIAVAERLLSTTFGGPVRLGVGHDLSSSKRSLVYRFAVVDGPSGIPASVIVKHAHSTKQAVYNPDVPEIRAWTFLNEWASLQFLSALCSDIPFGPRFYGGNRTAGVIVMEDIGTGKNLEDMLLGNDAIAAENALIDYAVIHGRLHAVSAGKQAAFRQLRESFGPSVLGDGSYEYTWLAPALQEFVEALDITPARGVEGEIEQLRAVLLNPGPFLVFTQQDACPDNCLYVGSSMRLLDFEGGMFEHALKEGVYGRVHFPTCHCLYRMPTHIPLHMEEVYRAELIKGCPEAADDSLFYRAVAEACVYWMLQSKLMLPPVTRMFERDRHIVGATDRERFLLRFKIAAQVTEELGYFEALGAAARAIATKLQVLWPEADNLAYYPAFQKSYIIPNAYVP